MCRGVRVPVPALFENLEDDASLHDFIEWSPGVSVKQARGASVDQRVCSLKLKVVKASVQAAIQSVIVNLMFGMRAEREDKADVQAICANCANHAAAVPARNMCHEHTG